jgi:hypothetical protein
MFLVEVEVSFVFDDFSVRVCVEREFPKISDGHDFVDGGDAELLARAVLADSGVVLPWKTGCVADVSLLGFRGGY